MKFRDYVGYGSAATLGFIVGNVPGAAVGASAYTGYKTWRDRKELSQKKLNNRKFRVRKRMKRKNMLIHGGNPKRFRVRAPVKTHKKIYRKRRVVYHRKKRKPTEARMSSRTTGYALSARKRTVKHLHKNKGNKKVRVSRRLRQKITKVIQGKEPRGFCQFMSGGLLNGTTNDNQQNSGTITSGYTTDNIGGLLFTPTQVNNVASILWNQKLVSTVGNKPATAITFNDNENFPFSGTQINVIKQWATVKMRNNGQRTLYVNVYAFESKVNRTASSASQEWLNALLEDNASSINILNSTINNLYVTPYLCKSLLANWKIETTKIIIKPGEEYVYTVQGPAKKYDYRKFWNGTTAWTMPKGSVQLVYTVRQDLAGSLGVSGAGVSYGRLVGPQDAGYGLIYELNEYYSLELPEQAGIQWNTTGSGNAGSSSLPATGYGTYLGNKRDAYCIYDFRSGSHQGNVVHMDIEDPTNIENQPEG